VLSGPSFLLHQLANVVRSRVNHGILLGLLSNHLSNFLLILTRLFLFFQPLLLLNKPLLVHEVIIEFDLADEASMLAPSVNGLEPLQDAVDYKRVVLVADSDQISMTPHITSFARRAISLSNIDANRTTSDTLNHFVQLEVLKTEYAEIAIIASCYNPVLSTTLTHSKRRNIIDLPTIES